ncbi:ketopantoate reductase family protein [Pseudonocardia sp. KRD291]|uniref:ketopantoate reductase family protein n=1 Tax=Pseudonocardia sp. KRD291 TaxID=2792007 RepID=UPI001C4A6912|nr:2-dehydropantoate 2-reductase N-terminal domain-containing protein [Pseudonocardia sp. KRD291]MBW0103089.1 ketopantoate reductase family protein [Pseudonocardia sp. KRD291]
MRYVVIGAGAVGGTIGARLAEAGRDVVLVARGRHLDVIRRRGLRLDDPDGSRTLAIPAVASVDELDWRPGDVALLATKTQDTEPILDALAAHVPDVVVACAQNGVANERMAAARFARVQAVLVILPAEHYEPGVVIASSAPVPGVLDVGTYPTGTDDVSGAIAADLTAAGFSSKPDPAVMDGKYGKLLTNLGNAVEAACGRDDPAVADLLAAVTDEGERVLAAAGITARTGDDDRVRRDGLITQRPVGGRERGGGSSWQSLRRGTGSIEAEYLNGEIVALGSAHGVATPVNAVMAGVAGEMAAAGEQPASRRGADLLAAAQVS